MFFDRGATADYDAWKELGNPGWGWDDLLPYFKKSENFTPAAEKFAQEWDISWDISVHGFSGAVQSSYPVFQWSYLKSFFDGWYSLGLTTPKDPGSGNKTGVFWAPSTLNPKDETRSYSRTAHYDRVIQSRPNYHLLTNNAGHKIVIEEGRGVGVTFIHRESLEVKTVKATKEVILAAGSIHSPQILQLSGIGSRVSLRRLGIEPIYHLPGVGQNFQDHPTLYPNFDFQSIPVPNIGTLTSNATYAAEQLELYWSQRQGPYTIVTHGGNTVAFLSLQELTPDYQRIINFAASQRLSGLYTESIDRTVMAGYKAQRSLILRLYNSTLSPVQEIKWNGETAMPLTLVKPLSRGSVSINSSDQLKPPVIDFGTLADPTDLETLIAALRINRALMASSPMQELSPVELSPGANLTTDAELRDALRSLLLPTFSHPCCTCSMMPRNLGGVVGPDLLVYGVEGLSIVDASIMPLIPATHTSSTVYAIAEKAAVLIQERHGLKARQWL
ncbi:GMC oxidoreductase [Zopfia rhizophila CBS 207.26]|uniref:GMC oxidoreductase n=1 Tax=Zopfia rhizophila CBS 207.26 TaxID=1314779 RepID=A0A6A6DRD5_9PEZI|nr:GMC oxidoreductase [Zopfia rhizophila CBS 207.26]